MGVENEDFSGIIPGQNLHPLLRGARPRAKRVGVSLLSEQRNLKASTLYPGDHAKRNNEVNRAMAAKNGVLATLPDTLDTLPQEMESLLTGL